MDEEVLVVVINNNVNKNDLLVVFRYGDKSIICNVEFVKWRK